MNPTVTIKTLKNYSASPGATAAAGRALDRLRAIAATATPEALALIATRRRPDALIADALDALAVDLLAPLADLPDAAREASGELKAEAARLKPLIGEAGMRTLDNAGRLTNIKSQRAAELAQPDARRKVLRAAGMSEAEVSALAPDADVSHLDAEEARLIAENATLDAFLRSGDDALLPADFAIRKPTIPPTYRAIGVAA
jgi:hypothetical protein